MKAARLPIPAQEASPSARLSGDAKLLAATVLLALLSGGLTAVSFYRVAALQADLEGLRAQLQGPRAPPAAGPEVSVRRSCGRAPPSPGPPGVTRASVSPGDLRSRGSGGKQLQPERPEEARARGSGGAR